MAELFLNYPLFLIGLPLLALPILIHLINLLRHRRIKWAAMEFLLAAHRKSNTWIILKQLLLLLLRIMAVAAVVLILAQMLLKEEWQRILGGITTHHVVLIDDTYSASDTGGDGKSVLDRAKSDALKIGEGAVNARSSQKFTLVRFSRPEKPDINVASVDRGFLASLRSAIDRIGPSQADTHPEKVLAALDETLDAPQDEKRIIYILSDFRAREWDSPKELNDRLTKLNKEGVEVKLVLCAEEDQHPNLTITSLAPRPGTVAAGVPVFMEVSVKNNGTTTARGVSVLLQEDGRTRSPVIIEEIRPGRTETRRFESRFATAGEHRIQATLEKDPVEADNARYAVVDVPVGVPALICDGDPEGSDGKFIGMVLDPGEPVRTGITPQIEQPRFVTTNPLEKFPVVYLCNVERLDPEAIKALEGYVEAGGGLAIFVSEKTNARYANEHLYKNGQGIFPVPLAAPYDLIADRLEQAPDLDVSIEHPVFRIFESLRADDLEQVKIWKYFAPAKDWKPDPNSTTKVIAKLRNGAPLAVEKTLGRGRIVMFMTTAAPIWNNWCRNPAFVVTVLELQSYLSGPRWAKPTRDVGQPIHETLDPTRYAEPYRLVLPDLEETKGRATIQEKSLLVEWDETGKAGIYSLHLAARDGRPEVRSFTYNVNPDEGNLALVGAEKLQARVTAPKTAIVKTGGLSAGAGDATRSSVSEFLLYALIFLLIGEQVLAYSASYHPPMAKGVPA
jgi:hypothetical protein